MRYCNDASFKFSHALICRNINSRNSSCNIRGGDGKMMTDLHTLILIILCGIVTLLVQIIPFVMISKVNLPATVIKWLSYIPITLFTALIIDGVIQQYNHTFGYTLNLSYVIAIIHTNCNSRHFYTQSHCDNNQRYHYNRLFTFSLLTFENNSKSLKL